MSGELPFRYQPFHERSRTPDNRGVGARRDRDRVLYSPAFRRLAGITQVVGAHEGHVFHNRLTHSLKVAQVGRRLAERLQPDLELPEEAWESQLDPDVVETACLVHDLGHPPFGHIAEKCLQTLIDKCHPQSRNSFEGNAQSFRIVTQVERQSLKFKGLDLTRASLRAILKYPWYFNPSDPKAASKWSAYRSEAQEFAFALGLDDPRDLPDRGPNDPPYTLSLEAQIMDWADDITYAVHDIEDHYRAGLIPLDRLQRLEGSEREAVAEYIERSWRGESWRPPRKGEWSTDNIHESLELLTQFAAQDPFQGTEFQEVALRTLVSTLIMRFLRDFCDLQFVSDDRVELHIDPWARMAIDVLKELTWYYVIDRPSLAAQQRGQERIITEIFEAFHEAAGPGSKKASLLPDWMASQLREEVDSGNDVDDVRCRLVCDLICGLTEDEAVRLHKRLTGVDPGSIVDRIV